MSLSSYLQHCLHVVTSAAKHEISFAHLISNPRCKRNSRKNNGFNATKRGGHK